MDAIHIVGAGGIGCALGYALRAGGHKVIFVDVNLDKVAWGRRHGVVVAGRGHHAADFVGFANWQPPVDAVVLLCTKCYDNSAVLARLPESATLIPVQNGFDADLQARHHPIEGIASFVSECKPDQTSTRITRRGDLHLGAAGEPTPLTRALVARLAGLLRRGPFRIRRVDDIRPIKHTKLMYNAAISPLAAAAGIDNGALLRVPLARWLFFALLRENYGILRAAAVELGQVGPFPPRWVARILARPWLADLLAHAFEPSLRGTYCSMAGDIARGQTEIDNYNGYLIHLAGKQPCPLNRAVHERVTHMERERMTPRIEVLQDMTNMLRLTGDG